MRCTSDSAVGVLWAALLLWGCSGTSPPPVLERSVSDLPADGMHQVRQGETLYAIAFRYGRDFRELAAINDLGEPYLIRVGQRLRLTRGGRGQARAVRRTGPAGGHAWMWPADGKLVAGFGADSKGIDVTGNVGDPVRAAADGEVVYAGSGLRGYGKLVIVKHDERTLSAYGHNRSLLVREGQAVKAGQSLARMGRRGGRTLLHFEIRRDGEPLDPLTLLPAR